MKVLTVFAHPASRSFCHAVLERFDAGLRESGHTNEILDLYAIGFDPILRERDNPSWLTKPSRMTCSSACGYARTSSSRLVDR